MVYAPFDPAQADGLGRHAEHIKQQVAKELPVALVDEFQDTDSIQYGIFSSIYGESSVAYVGDPKQAIYAFRGADVFSYFDASKDVGAQNRFALATNRRSDPGVITAVNTLFRLREPPFLLDDIRMTPALPHEERRSTLPSPMDVVLVTKDEIDSETASITADEVVALLSDGIEVERRPLAPSDLAVLCRTNKQAVEVTEALRAVGVPVSLDGDASVLNTDIAKDLRAVLEATLMPGDGSLVRRALLTDILGVSARELAAMNDETWSHWVSRFHAWNASWHTQGVVRFLEDVLRETRAEVAIAGRPDSRRVLTDLLHVQELLLRGERERHRDPIALMQWFRRLGEDSPDGGMVASEDLQQRADADSGAVRVSTIHKSKGLEYGIVLLPYTWGQGGLWRHERKTPRFHDDDGSLAIDLGSAEHDDNVEKAEVEALSESLRVLYVGVTRAKYGCILFWGPGGDWKKSALGYLLHGRDGAPKPYDESIEADVASFVEQSEGTVGRRRPRRDTGRLAVEASSTALHARERTRRFQNAPRIASFTSLTGHEEKTPAPRSADAPRERSGLFADLPGGVRTGLLLHAILERANFSEMTGEQTTAVIERALREFGFDAELGSGIQRDLGTVARTAFDDSGNAPRLLDLGASNTLRELEFTLHVERPRIESLVTLLETHGAPAKAPEYPAQLAKIGTGALHGFLRGFIDLMFEWDGRWYVADYKSNSLPTYEQDAIADSVQREHYLLQGLLYSAAAHRYLRQRIRDYDPALHWGGSLFLFLRGMRGHDGESVFFERHTPALLAGLDEWLGGIDAGR